MKKLILILFIFACFGASAQITADLDTIEVEVSRKWVEVLSIPNLILDNVLSDSVTYEVSGVPSELKDYIIRKAGTNIDRLYKKQRVELNGFIWYTNQRFRTVKYYNNRYAVEGLRIKKEYQLEPKTPFMQLVDFSIKAKAGGYSSIQYNNYPKVEEIQGLVEVPPVDSIQ